MSAAQAMLTFFAPASAGALGFARDGETVATSEPLDIAGDRYNYVVLHGDPDAPEVLVVDGPRERRRVRVVNVRRDGADIELALLDADGAPLGDASTIEHGTAFSEVVAAEVAAVRVSTGDAAIDVPVSCDPAFTLIAYDEPASPAEVEALEGTPFLGLRQPTAPGSEEDTLSRCFDPDCSCDTIE